ncbi:hypothetical protein K1T71_013101 [Dendrolimus kikuchii]|uniref:Uncharacterized protein n=1 Tax=Dendrolimus kikuchii TaxID=765133 RepID=A0ACC1CJ12_9NEOP|nr:hypothetical protein K1T71_013101 [Dendrolimus kikuchii]
MSNFKNIIICGDINIDISKDTPDKRSHDYLNVLASHCLLPGHLSVTHGKTCLDHMILKTNLDAKCLIIDSSITDHLAVAVFLNFNADFYQHSNKVLKRIDYNGLDTSIEKININSILCCDDQVLIGYIGALIEGCYAQQRVFTDASEQT